jgi:molybdopterin molybdotransferase
MAELGQSPLAAGNELPVATARQAIAEALKPITGSETVPLLAALGRVLAEDVVSPIAVPAHDNSAMDGYALRGADLRTDGPTRLAITGPTVLAGMLLGEPVGTGQCVRIMTGAPMPAGLDTVVPQELCQVEGGVVSIAAGALRAGENRRKRGEDLAQGKPALMAGRVLGPAELGLVASLGVAELRVVRRLKVALFSTGNELRTLGQPLPEGCIFDSNRYSLMGALMRLGVEVIDLGLVPDDPLRLAATLDEAIARADVVLTSGGVSVGDADYTKDLLASRGEVAFWKVAMRPGRPFAFGPLHGAAGKTAWLFALPGNPVAALVTFYVFARDALRALAGAQPRPLPSLKARSTAAIRKRPGRSEFQRAVVGPAADGSGWEVRLTGAQGAGILRSMAEANALVVLGHGQGSVAAGDEVEVWLFDGLV